MEEEKRIKKLSQKQLIKAHLVMEGSITPKEAFEKYGCFRLAARIADLRRDGMVILTERNEVKHYAVYTWIPAFNDIAVEEVYA